MHHQVKEGYVTESLHINLTEMQLKPVVTANRKNASSGQNKNAQEHQTGIIKSEQGALHLEATVTANANTMLVRRAEYLVISLL